MPDEPTAGPPGFITLAGSVVTCRCARSNPSKAALASPGRGFVSPAELISSHRHRSYGRLESWLGAEFLCLPYEAAVRPAQIEVLVTTKGDFHDKLTRVELPRLYKEGLQSGCTRRSLNKGPGCGRLSLATFTASMHHVPRPRRGDPSNQLVVTGSRRARRGPLVAGNDPVALGGNCLHRQDRRPGF
jgi:hypothetical protein